jgi:hypothetical protein
MCCKLRLEVGQGKPSLCGCLEVCFKLLGMVYGFRVWFSYKLDQSSSIYKKGMLLAHS